MSNRTTSRRWRPEARLIALVPGRVDRYTFVRALVRSTLYRELPTSRRLRLHRRVGLELEARRRRRQPAMGRTGRHFSEAASLGEVDRAVRYGTLAGVEPAGLAFEEPPITKAPSSIELLDEPDRPASRREARARQRLRRAATIGPTGRPRRRAGGSVTGRLAPRRAVLSLTGSDTGAADPVDDTLIALLEEALAHLAAEDSVLRPSCSAAMAVELMWEPTQQERRPA